MKKSLWLPACFALIAFAGCETAPTQQAAAKSAASPEAMAAIAAAEQEIAAAKKANNMWRDTEKFLNEAKKAADEGKNDEAIKLAKKAAKEAQLSVKQAAAESNAKPHFPK